jgi:DNA-binding NarL/FixJ family response regulator
LIGKGNEVRQIAKLLNLSPKTVEKRTGRTSKTNSILKNSREVARFALQWLQARGGVRLEVPPSGG